MTLKLNDKYLKSFIGEEEYANIQPMVKTAQNMIVDRSGAGNDFLGWVDLPENYDKAEFAAIKESARTINQTIFLLLVISANLATKKHRTANPK